MVSKIVKQIQDNSEKFNQNLNNLEVYFENMPKMKFEVINTCYWLIEDISKKFQKNILLYLKQKYNISSKMELEILSFIILGQSDGGFILKELFFSISRENFNFQIFKKKLFKELKIYYNYILINSEKRMQCLKVL